MEPRFKLTQHGSPPTTIGLTYLGREGIFGTWDTPKGRYMTESALLPLSNDLTFKIFFKSGENRGLLISLLSSFLPLPEGSRIVNVEVLDPELPPDEVSRVGGSVGKKYVLDLKVRFERTTPGGTRVGESVNVECQTTSQPYMTDRLLAYASRLYGEQLREGDSYQKLDTVYSLLFTTKNLPDFADSPHYNHVCNIRETREPVCGLFEGAVLRGRRTRQI